MSKTHWKKFTNPDYLGAYSVEDEDLIVTIKSVGVEKVTGAGGKTEEEMVVRMVDEKPLILNKTNAKAIAKALGSNYVEDWTGRSIALYVEHDVPAFGERVDAIRVRPYAPKVSNYICADCGSVIADNGKYKAKVIANQSLSKFGAYLCMDCAKARKAGEND